VVAVERTSSSEIAPPEPPLADDAVVLRAFDERDLPTLERAANDQDVVSAFGSASAGDALAFHRRRWEDGSAAAFAICPGGGGSVGGVLLEPRRAGVAAVGYWLLPEARGQGYATRAVRLLTEWGIRALGFARVELWATVENDASQRVAERAGFQREGVLRAYAEGRDGGRLDAIFFSLVASDLVPRDRDGGENSAGAPARAAALRQVRDTLERLVRDGTAVARSDGTVHELFPVAASAAEGEALREWVGREGATRTIEVGLGYAISTLFICEGLLMSGDETARHVAIDPFQRKRFSDCGLQFLDEAGVAGLVEHYDEESQVVLPRLLGEGRSFDLAFVDGNHRFDGVFLDLFYLGRLVRPGRVVLLDDYQLPGVAKAASFFFMNLGWTLEAVSAADDLHQWAVVRTSDRPDTRRFDDYADF
jgi:RimJ/RimL family protein N-acetyltransferase/predicted O-methyltransferase YrrM